LAVADFYAALTAFVEGTESQLPGQPTDVDCIEGSGNTNWFRHGFVEFLRDHHVLAHAFPEFQAFDPPALRRAYRSQLIDGEYFDEVHQCVDSIYSCREANDEAQSMYRYRLVVFSNFLTTPDFAREVEPILSTLFSDLHPGAAVMVLGASGGAYPDIYQSVDELAQNSGLTTCVNDESVRVEPAAIQGLIQGVRLRVYDHLASLAKADEMLERVAAMLADRRWPASALRVYRKSRPPRGGSRAIVA
jgi:hypothetical protein